MGGLQKIFGVNLWIAFAEHGVACDKNFCPGANHVTNGIECDAAIDFDAKIQPAFGTQLAEATDFVERARDEFLAAKAGIDRHHQDVINHVEHLAERVDGRRGIDDHTGLCPMILDVMKGAIQVDAGFLMHRDPVRAGLHEVRNELVRVLNHEVTIERQVGDFAEGTHDGRTDGDVGNKMAVHDVDMDDGSAAFGGAFNAFRQMGKVSRQNRWCKFDQNLGSRIVRMLVVILPSGTEGCRVEGGGCVLISKRHQIMHMPPTYLPTIFSLVAALMWGCSDFFGGFASKKANAFLFTALVHLSGMIFTGSSAILTGATFPGRHAVIWSLAAGTVGGAALAIFYRALAAGQMGLTAPIGAVLGAALPTIFDIRTEGSPGLVPVAGFLLAGVGVWLISRTEGGIGRPKGLGMAVLAGLGFGCFYVFVRQAGNDSAWWIATISRSASLVVTTTIVLAGGCLKRMSSSTIGFGVACGLLDVGGTVLFVRASQNGRLDFAVVLSSLYPAITVLLARAFLHEHFSRWKAVGMVAAIVAVPMIAAG